MVTSFTQFDDNAFEQNLVARLRKRYHGQNIGTVGAAGKPENEKEECPGNKRIQLSKVLPKA